MVLFCPTCHNMLLLRRETGLEFYCRTCPYLYAVQKKFTRKTMLKPKKADEPISDSLENEGAKIPDCGFRWRED